MSERALFVLLAAGAGTRFAGPTHKLLAPLGGRPVVGHALANALAAGHEHVLIVAGASPLPDDLAHNRRVTIVTNPRWAEGQATSVQVAIAAAAERGADAVVIGLADQPSIAPDAWRRVADCAAPIAYATYDGTRGNPVRIHRDVWPLLATTGDVGARHLIRLRPDLAQPVPCTGSPADIDSLNDLERAEELLQWQNRSSTNSP